MMNIRSCNNLLSFYATIYYMWADANKMFQEKLFMPTTDMLPNLLD